MDLRDVKEFFHLMDVPLPVVENHQHYLDMLSSMDASFLIKKREFENFIELCSERSLSVEEYRKNHAIPAFLNWANGSGTFDSLVFMEKNEELEMFDHTQDVKGEMLISISMQDPYYSSMRIVSFQRGVKLPEDWMSLMEQLNVDPFLAKSEIFKKQCFDAYEPHKLEQIQKHIMTKLVKRLKQSNELVKVSPAEVIMKYSNQKRGDIIEGLNDIYGFASSIMFAVKGVKDVIVHDTFVKKDKKNMELEKQLSIIKEKKNLYVSKQNYEMAAKIRDDEKEALKKLREHYEFQLANYCTKESHNKEHILRTEYGMVGDRMVNPKKSLINIPDNRFYVYFRTAIMQEPLEDLDLEFMMNGYVAKWSIEEKIV